MNARVLTDAELRLAARDAAELLYEHGVGGVVVTTVASTALFAMLHGSSVSAKLAVWLVVILLTIAARALDLVAGRQRRMLPQWDGRAEVRRFARPVMASALAWGVLPVAFFNDLSQVDRTAIAMIVSAMAAGGATVFAAERRLCIMYCATLLLPLAAMFLLTPGQENTFLGWLALIFLLIMINASKMTNRAAMSAIRLYRANQVLMRETERERETSERINAELVSAQVELSETLESLEERINERTADLEHEIRERERFGRELVRLASQDALTGLCNRTSLTERLDDEIRYAQDTDASLAVLFLDLDKFKEVNDLKGHHAGDTVLREVARRLTEMAPRDAIVARWGGDEFVFVLRDTGAAHMASTIGERLRHGMCEPISCGTEIVHVGATIGIARFPDHGRTADELIAAADMAMYAGKDEGRGRVQTFDPALADAVYKRLILGQALQDAIGQDALRLEYQPIVAANSGRCESLEALLRWNHPTRGPISPIEFIPLAERSGDIIPIGRWVLAQACAAAATWPGDPAPTVSVNVSVAQIEAGGLLEDVRVALTASGLAAQRLHIEVTESLFASDHEQIIPTLVALRALGVRISLDDFGTGFSSLGALQWLPIDILKIDKSFIDHVEDQSGPIVTAIRSLAYALDIEIVAEGVESVNQAELLRSMGVHYFQGYLYSRPLPAHHVNAWLLQMNESSADANTYLPPENAAGVELHNVPV